MKTRLIKKSIIYTLIGSVLLGGVTPALAGKDSIGEITKTQETDKSESLNTTVYAEVGSFFKVTIPKHIILDGTEKEGNYLVDVSGDIAGNETIYVIPDDYFKLSSINKLDIYAYIEQERISWNYNTMGTTNGYIDANDITAGSWNGNFNFNIKLESSKELNSNATNSNGEQVEFKVENVTGEQKEQLLDALIQSGQISDKTDVMLNIGDIENVDNVEIDTSDIANPGDTVVIVQEKQDEWDYVSTETVNSNNKVYLNASNKTPVSFVQTQTDGTIHVHVYEEQIAVSATCETDGTLLMNCECNKAYSFTIPANHELEVVEKKDENGNLINKYYECENCTYSILNLTKLFAGDELSHDCNNYLISKYDEKYHWQECSVCETIINDKNIHNYTENWTMGNSCSSANKLMHTCSCGYSYTTNNTRNHTLFSYLSYNHTYHVRLCSVCLEEIQEWALHTNSAGQIINCSNPGTCKPCGAKVTNLHEAPISIKNDGINGGKCSTCGKQCINISGSSINVTYNDTTFTATTNIHIPNAISTPSCGSAKFYVSSYGSVTSSNANWNASTKILTITIKGYYNNIETSGEAIVAGITYTDNTNTTCSIPAWLYICPEKSTPIINKIIENNLSENNNWATSKQITFGGTENYCKTIKLTLKDTSGTTYFSNISVPVSNKNWEYTCTPNIEANETGKEFILITTDTLGNSSSKTFIVSKTDKKAPTPSLNTTTTTEWSKTKEMLFSATDEGSGNLQIAFNNINEYMQMTKNNTLYTKTYQFSGDVYGEILAAIYYKDAVGNVATQFIKVHNLDNTAPTILNLERNENIITIKANDLNKELELEGSGISGYAMTWTSAPPQETDWQETNQFEITKGGTYYFWVKDAVGNVSECRQIKILL